MAAATVRARRVHASSHRRRVADDEHPRSGDYGEQGEPQRRAISQRDRAIPRIERVAQQPVHPVRKPASPLGSRPSRRHAAKVVKRRIGAGSDRTGIPSGGNRHRRLPPGAEKKRNAVERSDRPSRAPEPMRENLVFSRMAQAFSNAPPRGGQPGGTGRTSARKSPPAPGPVASLGQVVPDRANATWRRAQSDRTRTGSPLRHRCPSRSMRENRVVDGVLAEDLAILL